MLQMARVAEVPEAGEEAQTIRKLCHQVPKKSVLQNAQTSNHLKSGSNQIVSFTK